MYQAQFGILPMNEHSLAKIPATIVTGFLGAGKTTLIRNLLENADGRRIALIVNEFGDIGIDGDLLRDCGDACAAEDLVELTNGCICCTVADDFIPTMKKLVERDRKIDHIVIETSGLALPQPLVNAFNWPGVRERVTVDGVVTVVDAGAVAEGRFAADEEEVQRQRLADDALDHESPLEELYEDQLGCADMVVLNKTDLVEATHLERIEAEIGARLARPVKVLRSRNGQLPADIMLGLNSATEADISNRKSHHELEEQNGIAHDHDDFTSFVFETGSVADAAHFLAGLPDLLAKHDVLRLKGFLAVKGRPMRQVVQCVGSRVEAYFDRDWDGGEKQVSRLVVIGLAGMDEVRIRTAIAELAA
jgi:cobalamin biosynthesis protein CobW